MKTCKWLIVLLSCAALSVGTGVGGEKEDKQLLEAAMWNNLNMMKIAIGSGANIDARGEFNNTPLHYATNNGALDAIKYLVKIGANVNAKNDNDATPLHLTTLHDRREEAASFLIARGADLDPQTRKERETPLLSAVKSAPSMVGLLLKSGADVDIPDNRGATPLFTATISGQYDLAKLLLRHNAQTNLANNKNNSPDTIAQKKGYKDLPDLLQKEGDTLKGGKAKKKGWLSRMMR